MAVNFEIETIFVQVGKDKDKGFSVRGLNSEDLVFLTRNYLIDMQTIVAKFAVTGHGKNSPLIEIAVEIIKDFPSMVIDIISRCSESTTAADVEKFRRLSFSKQFEAVRAIMKLSQEDGGIDLKKVLGFVASLFDAQEQSTGPLTSILKTIIVTPENQLPS